MRKFLFFIPFVLSFALFPVYSANAETSIPTDTDIVDTSNHTYTYSELQEDITALTLAYPDHISYSSMGKSVDNRDITQIVIGNPDAPKAIYVHAAIHAREWMNTWILMAEAEQILRNWEAPVSEGVTYGDVFEQCALYIIPMVNPDGVTISQYGISGIVREDLKARLYQMPGASSPSCWKANANGVDLNRNFSTGWGTRVNTSVPSSAFYNGPHAFSEPEVIAVTNAVMQRHFDIAISYHSMEGAIYWDLSQTGSLYQDSLTLARQAQQITGYKLGEKSVVHGLDYNWMCFEAQIPTILIETGTVACPLPYSQWGKIWLQNRDLLAKLAVLYLV